MHPNPVFHTHQEHANLTFARHRGFGTLAVNGAEGPLLAHVPFLLDDDGQTAWLHIMRSNPIARAARDPIQCKIAVTGPDSYISPDWYEVPDQVPTWNYVSVHLTGRLEVLPQSELRGILDRESAFFEERLAPKPAWTSQKMTPEVMERMMRMVVPCRVEITAVDGTWKLNQNKPDEVRLRAADRVANDGIGSELGPLAALMRDPDGQS